MPPPRKIDLLPEDVRQALNERIVKNGFGGYVELSHWLSEQGYSIGKSAIGEHGKDFKERLVLIRMATDQAKAIIEASPDDAGAMTEANIRIAQMNLQTANLRIAEDPSPKNVSALAKASADLARASVTSKKWMTEVKARLDAQKKKVADQASTLLKKQGLSDADAGLIRAQILGIEVDG